MPTNAILPRVQFQLLVLTADTNCNRAPFTAYSCRVLKNLENDTLLDYMRYKEIKLNDKLILYLIEYI